MGEEILNTAFWSHAAASQLAAKAAGRVPPNTNPKYLAPLLVTVFAEPTVFNISITSSGLLDESGNGTDKFFQLFYCFFGGKCTFPRQFIQVVDSVFFSDVQYFIFFHTIEWVCFRFYHWSFRNEGYSHVYNFL